MFETTASDWSLCESCLQWIDFTQAHSMYMVSLQFGIAFYYHICNDDSEGAEQDFIKW